MPDTIELRGLVALGRCGILPEEIERPQPFEIDLDLQADLSLPGATDDLADTIDYGRVCVLVEQVVTTERFGLLERLADRIAEVVLGVTGVISVTVAVRKLRPPVPVHLTTAGVRITRHRSA